MTGQWFSLGTPVSSTNNTERHDTTEILLKVVLNTITLTLTNLGTRFLILILVEENGNVFIQKFVYIHSIDHDVARNIGNRPYINK